MGNLTSRLTVQLIDQLSGPAKSAAGSLTNLKGSFDKLASSGSTRASDAVKRLAKDITLLERVQAFGRMQQDLTNLTASYERARSKLRSLTDQLSAVANPSQKLIASFERQHMAVTKAEAALRSHKSSMSYAASGLQAAGVAVNSLASAEARLAQSIRGGTAAINQQAAAAARSARRREAAGMLASGFGVTAAYRAKDVFKKAFTSAAEFDIGVRKQRVFTDISADDQKKLIAQALRVGKETPYTNIDVVNAQTKAMQGLPSGFSTQLRAEVAEGIIENVKNYAMIMETDLATSAEAVRSYLQATQKDISTKEKALAEANKATNQLVKMAKLGGMSDEDVQQYMKFAASSGTVAGLSSDSLMAIAALARRGGLRGDEAGVFMRTAASKLVAPTNKGRTALATAGINYDDYVTRQTSLSQDGLEAHLARKLGRGFDPKTAEAVRKVLADPNATRSAESFVPAVTSAVEGAYGRKGARGKGSTKTDTNRIAKAVGEFYGMTGGKVDSERLIYDIMKSNMSLAQLNAFFTDKHGGKFAITQAQRDEYVTSRKAIYDAGNDPDYAKKKAEEIYGGLGGAAEKLKGSIETFYQTLGTSNEAWLKPVTLAAGDLVDKFSSLSGTTQMIVTAAGTIAAVLGGTAGSLALVKAALTGGGASVALTGSAAALTEAAGALNVAAARLGTGGAAGAAVNAAGGAGAGAGAGAAGGAAGWLARGAGLLKAGALAAVAAAAAAVVIDQRERNQERFKGVAPGEEHNLARKQWRKGLNTVLKKGRPPEDDPHLIGPTGSQGGASEKIRVDTSEIAAARQEASTAGPAMQSSLSVTARPEVDTSSIMAAERMVDRLRGKLLGLGTDAGGIATNVRRTFADIGVSE